MCTNLAFAQQAEPQYKIFLSEADGKQLTLTGTSSELLTEADKLVDKGEYDRAKSFYQQMIENDPRDVRSHVLLGQLYQYKFRKYAEAIRQYKKAARLVPMSNAQGQAFTIRLSAEAYRELAEKTNSLIYFVQAISEYEKVLEIDPENIEVIYYMGTCRLNSKDYDHAAQLFRLVIEKKPDGEWAKNAKKALTFAESEARKKR